jgi:hypothetical protein
MHDVTAASFLPLAFLCIPGKAVEYHALARSLQAQTYTPGIYCAESL